MFKIYDGRKFFYQWDINQRLIVDDSSITEVHFCNRTEECSLVCEVYKENGLNLVNVPNILFHKYFDVNVYGYDGNSTKHSERFMVMSRSKPADYVYTETEVKNWEEVADNCFKVVHNPEIWTLEKGAYRVKSGFRYRNTRLPFLNSVLISEGYLFVMPLDDFSSMEGCNYFVITSKGIYYGAITVNNGFNVDTGKEEVIAEGDLNWCTKTEDISSSSTNTEFPTAEAVYNYVNSRISSGGNNGGSGENWVELLNTATEAETAYIDVIAEEGKRFKKLHILISTSSAGLSTAAKIKITASTRTIGFSGSNGDNLTITSAVVNTYAFPVFLLESGNLFPIALACNGAVNGATSAPLYMGGVGQNASVNTDAKMRNNGPWQIIRIAPANATFNAGVRVYVWGVYE